MERRCSYLVSYWMVFWSETCPVRMCMVPSEVGRGRGRGVCVVRSTTSLQICGWSFCVFARAFGSWRGMLIFSRVCVCVMVL